MNNACALWHLGYPDQAINIIRDRVIQAREVSHPFNLAYALYFAAMIYQFSHMTQAARESTEEMLQISNDYGFSLYLRHGNMIHGWILVELGQTDEGIAQLRKGIAMARATKAESILSLYLTSLADSYRKTGNIKEGLSVLSEALALMDGNGERMWEAELHRIKGELLLMQGEAETDVAACFCQAIDVARRQSAKSLELRAAISLSRLWQKVGRKEEVQSMLRELYDWFTEGFDTRDLQEAKALLEELS